MLVPPLHTVTDGIVVGIRTVSAKLMQFNYQTNVRDRAFAMEMSRFRLAFGTLTFSVGREYFIRL